MRKYVIGRVRLMPGTREEYLQLHKPYVMAARKEAGLVFYDEGLNRHDPDGLIVVECWETAEAHAAHTKQAHYVAFTPVFQKYAVSAHFDEIDAAKFQEVKVAER